VNPAHLFVGSKTDNAIDRDSKSRQARGSRLGMSKLTEADVLVIRAAHSPQTSAKLRAFFKIGATAYYAVVNRRTWQHV